MTSREIIIKRQDVWRTRPFGRGKVQCSGQFHHADERGKPGMRIESCTCEDGAAFAATAVTTVQSFD